MLSLRVNAGEYVKIGENIRVCVTKGKNEGLTLSIDAPKDIKVLRGEVIDRMEKEDISPQQRSDIKLKVTT